METFDNIKMCNLNSNSKEPIYNLYHISDINIHCEKRHQEYKQIFLDFVNDIKTENTAVVITGNLLNTKNRITSEEIILAREFIFNISLKCPVIIIPGNNDKHENINAIISHGNLPIQNINYIYEKGCYTLNNIDFIYLYSSDQYSSNNSISSISSNNSISSISSNNSISSKNKITIALHYGVVGKCILYNGKYSTNKKINVETFEPFDYTFLGGISNTQFLDKNKKIGYAGSMIQKDYNEDWNNHGYLLWDIQNNKVIHKHLHNNYRYITLKIVDGQLMTPLIDLPNYLYIKWDIVENGIINKDINDIQNKIRKQYNVEEEIYVNQSFVPNIPEMTENKCMFDLSIEKQKEYAISWLLSEGKILNNKEQETLYFLIKKYNNSILSKENSYIKWKLIDLEFENILCYNKKQKIYFENLKGIHGIIAENNAGKSAIFDILVFSLFGKSTRTDTYSYNDLIYSNDSNENNLFCAIQFQDMDTKDIYKITRKSKGSKCFVIIEKNKITLHDGSTREANNYITSILGTYDDFMTITFMAQQNYHNFLLMSGKNQKEFIFRIFQLDIYDTFHKLSKNEMKELKINTNNIKEKMKDFQDTPEKLDKLKKTLDDLCIQKKELENKILNSCQEKDKLIDTLQPYIQDSVKITLPVLKQINIKNIENSNHFKEQILNFKDNLDKLSLETELKELIIVDTDSLYSELENTWNTIQDIFNFLNEVKDKKKIKKTNYSIYYDKMITKINKYIEKYTQYLHLHSSKLSEKELEIKLEILKEELLECINNKPVNILFIYLEKAKDKYKFSNISDLNNILLSEELKLKDVLSEELKLKDVLPNYILEDTFDLNVKVLNDKIILLQKIKDKIKRIDISKDKLKNYKYDEKCKYCCSNPFVIEAKKEMEKEETILIDYKNINEQVENLSLKHKFIQLSIQQKDYELNINNIKLALSDYDKYIELQNKIIKVDEIIKNKNNELVKNKKELKIVQSFISLQNKLDFLIKLKENFIIFHNKLQETNLYNNTLDKKRSDIQYKLNKLLEYTNLKNNILNTEKDIERIEKEIEIKENNEEIKQTNDSIKKEITMFSDFIDNYNIKLINIIKKETELYFNIEKYEIMIKEYNQNKLKLTDLENQNTIFEYFISMTHHNGIPSYLLKKITNLLQDNANIILSKYSDMQIKIKNEDKEICIQVYKDTYKNGLNTKMLCGSEKFLVELSFRIAFQTLSNVSKPTFFICDEGWSCLDEKTRSNLNYIFTTLLEYNEYILTVSHIDDVRKWMNHSIKITIDHLNERQITQ